MSNLGKRRSRLSRQPSGKRLKLTARDIEILKLLNRYRYLRSSFAHAFFRAEKSRFLRRLGELYHDGGYLDRPKRQYLYANALYQPAVYELSAAGREVLRYHGCEPLKADRQAGTAGETRNFAHALMICDILGSIEIGCLRSGQLPAEFDDDEGRDGLVGYESATGYSFLRPGVRFITQQEIIEKAPCRDFDNPFKIPIDGELKSVTPDGLFGIQYVNGYRFFAVEADRGTEPMTRGSLAQASYRRKLMQYQRVIEDGSYKKHLGTSSFFVLHVTTSEERKEKMMETMAEIAIGSRGAAQVFKVMKGDWMTAPPADGHMFRERWESAGYAPFDISRG